MKGKGFTLIELLAVIVILAIISLIATPTIINIISDTKVEANKRSIDMYAKAVENAIMQYQIKENKKTTSFDQIKKYIKYEGDKVDCEVNIYEDGSIYLSGCRVNNGDVLNYTYGQQQTT